MTSTFNYYELLGVKKNATIDEIKNAYKKQMKKWHPDLNKSNEAVEMSSKINEAKEVLLDPIRRQDYDEYLDKKINENFNRYTQRKSNNANNKTKNQETKNSEYEEKKVTKWQYLKDWLKYAKVSYIRKLIGLIGVLLESLLCLIIKLLLITLAYISNMGSYIIRYIFNYLLPIYLILLTLLIFNIVSSNLNAVIDQNNGMFIFLIVSFIIYISSFFMPLLSKALLSEKSFDILYNKIDINLFKKCVSYDK